MVVSVIERIIRSSARHWKGSQGRRPEAAKKTAPLKFNVWDQPAAVNSIDFKIHVARNSVRNRLLDRDVNSISI
jgi:hypothetical protein